jgi:protein-arginine kinase
MQLLPDIPLYTLNRLLVWTQTAHVAESAGVTVDDEALPEHRARFVRRMLEEVDRR